MIRWHCERLGLTRPSLFAGGRSGASFVLSRTRLCNSGARHMKGLIIMREWARDFYSSAAWARCREAYRESVGELCEDCLKNGLVTPATDVHHIVHLTPENIRDPNITLNWDNLAALCRDCHAKRHTSRRYRVDAAGRLIVR